ncbi:MAG: hypothetical protein RJA70_2040 [Pseudomonadota bacterium]|jgi:transcriptional regulator of acetoin/glycerol metabolism
MQHSIGHTLVDEPDAALSAHQDTRGAHLFVLLEGDRPLGSSSRHQLVGTTSVALGRGTTRQTQRPGTARRVDLELQFPDARMSGRHALLTRSRLEWVLEDCSSKNGTRVNGKSTEKSALQDGDIIEMGRTLLLFRDDLVCGDRPDLCATDDPVPLTLLPSLERRLGELRRLAPNASVNLLLLGESGTGKELLAREVAGWSGRQGPFVGVNCGAIAETLVESELFGAVKGAYSGAAADRPGLIRSADTGCLFLDEIADLPRASQASLLRVLQEREVTPVGATRPIPVDVRVLSATHQDLHRAVDTDDFREDLYARIAGFTMTLPPLRDRLEDLGLLVGTILHSVSHPHVTITTEALLALYNYDWPHNIRELHSSLATAATLADRAPIALQHLPESVRRGPSLAASTADSSESIDLSEDEAAHRGQLIELLKTHSGNVSAVARETGKARMQIQRWLKRYGINATTFRV